MGGSTVQMWSVEKLALDFHDLTYITYVLCLLV